MLLYLYKTNQYIGKYGYLYTPQEVAEADILERNQANSQQHYSFHQLLEIFPSAKSSIVRNLKKEIQQCKDDLIKAEEVRIKYNNEVLGHIEYKNKWLYSIIRDIFYIEPLTEGRERKIKRNIFLLSSLKPYTKTNPDQITDKDIAIAKEVPLETLYMGHLYKRGSNFIGLCPFHSDKNPSFVIYTKTNRWWCYACVSGGDVIDFVSKIRSCDFLTAVKTILNK